MTSDTVSGNGNRLLDEEQLRRISRSIRSFVPSSTSPKKDTNDELKDLQLLFENVLFTCSSSGLTAGHRVAAWNTLCSLIDQIVVSPRPDIKRTTWTEHLWTRAFRLYLTHAQSARPRSSRQLLVTLTSALRKYDEIETAQHKQSALKALTSGLGDFEDPYRARASAQLLGHLLNKDLASIRDVLAEYTGTGLVLCDSGTPALASGLEDLLEVLFRWLGKADFGSTIAQLVSTFLDKYDEICKDATGNEASTRPVWTTPLEAATRLDEVNLSDLRAHVLPMLFKRSFNGFVDFLQVQNLASLTPEKRSSTFPTGHQQTLLLAALQTGKDIGIIVETEEDIIRSDRKCLMIPVSRIGRLLLRSSRSARLTGLHMLVTSFTLTKPFSREALKWMKRGLDICSADVDADLRSDLFSALQKLVDRIRSITAVLARNSASEQNATSSQHQTLSISPKETLSYHREFLEWLPRFLAWELRPTASYQRHISGLKCLSILARSGLDEQVPVENWSRTALQETKWPFHTQVLTADMRQLLLDLVLDPFDDVRQTASSILGFCCSATTGGSGLEPKYFQHALERAESAMLKTGRADQADGVAHIYALVYRSCSISQAASKDLWSSKEAVVQHLIGQMQLMLHVAHKSLAEAVRGYPIHGLLISLRYVLAQGYDLDEKVRNRLIEQTRDIWTVVKPVLCNDAPEGYVPNELEELPESTKETLSYCWRALKEASLLLSTLLAGYRPAEAAGEKDATLADMGNLCFTQLAELRHRGAFSTVAQTWTACCLRCQGLRTQTGAPILELWYGKTIDLLRNNVTINTRRSAGLPALLCGILIADMSSKLLAQTFMDLEVISRQDVDAHAAEEGSLAQVHSMNCLKDVFKNTRLGEQSERYIPTGLQLAADALRSEVWAIRNCGLMLFRALIDRLLGTDQSHFEDHVAGQKYISVEQQPELLNVILGLLPQPHPINQAEATSIRYEGVFPALQLLQHTRIPDSRLQEVQAAVHVLTASPSWHVRDKAARALASLTVIDTAEGTLQSVKQLVDSTSSQNALHGALLTARYTVNRLRRTSKQKLKPISGPYDSLIQWPWGILQEYAKCNTTRAACIDLARECLGILDLFSGPPFDFRDLDWRVLYKYLGDAADPPRTASETDRLPILSSCLRDPTAAVLRQAFARWIACIPPRDELLAEEQEIPPSIELMLELATLDEDAVVYFLRALKLTHLDLIGRAAVRQFTSHILTINLGIELKCVAQDILTALPAPQGGHELAASVQDVAHTQQYLSWPDCNQRFADGALQLQAVQLDRREASSNPEGHLREIESWANDYITAIEGTGVHTREAAAEAISRIEQLWSSISSRNELDAVFQRICIGIYDLLNDDDEDIRLLAAKVTSRILATATEGEQPEYEPIVSSQKLLGFCISRWPTDTHLAAIAFQRAFGITEDTIPQSSREQIIALSHGDTALFAEEKQNLYLDDAREVRVWSQVIQKMSPKAASRTLINRLAFWVGNRSDALKSQAETVPGGALGWSSKANVFTPGLKVLYGAEVLLSLVKQGARIPVRPSSLRRKLYETAVAFDAGGVSPLWRREIEKILAESVMHKVQVVGRRAAALFP